MMKKQPPKPTVIKQKKQTSSVVLYGVAIGAVMVGASIISLKNSLFPEPLSPCTQRYAGGIRFPEQKADAEPLNIRDIQGQLGFDEWGLVENVNLVSAPQTPPASAAVNSSAN